MTRTLKKELSIYDSEEYREPELDDSVYHPANNEFKQSVKRMQRRIVSIAMQMRPKHAMIARELASGALNNTEIAKKYRCSPPLVTTIRKRDDAQELIGCIKHLQELKGGTIALEREMMLWGIALREQETDPRTSIAAIGEINRMKMDTEAQQFKKQADENITNQPNIIIQLADPRLLPSKLDQHPQPQMKDVN